MPVLNSPLARTLYAWIGVWMGGFVLVACSGPAPESRSQGSEVEPGTRIYHVQLRLTENKDQAAETLGRAEQWWNKQPSADRPPLAQGTQSSDPAVNITWKPPFYRVQLGPFASEEEAEAVLKAAESAFPDAFVAPDRAETPSTKQ